MVSEIYVHYIWGPWIFMIFSVTYCNAICKNGTVHHLLDTGQSVCCLPVKCPKGFEVKPCSKYFGNDTCQPCPSGTEQPLNWTDSKAPLPCQPKCAQGAHRVIKSGTMVCECDMSRNYYGHDPMNCQKALTPCPEGSKRDLDGNCTTSNFVPVNTTWDAAVSSTPDDIKGIKTIEKDNGSRHYLWFLIILPIGIGVLIYVLYKRRKSWRAKYREKENLDHYLKEKANTSLRRSLIEDENGTYQDLYEAIWTGKTDKVRKMIKKDIVLVNTPHRGKTPLILASYKGYLDIVKILLERGAQIDALDDFENTSLVTALERKHEDIAIYLLEQNANVRVIAQNNQNMLHLAASGNLHRIITKLLQERCDENAQDVLGDTPLHFAIRTGSNEVAGELLRASEIDLTIVNKDGFTALQLACSCGNASIMEKIIERDRSTVNSQRWDGCTALHLAAISDRFDCFRVLLDKGNAEVDQKNNIGLTALHIACEYARQPMAKLLIEKGADLNATCDQGNTPLHLVLNSKNLETSCERLTNQNSKSNRVQIAIALLQNGAYINSKNKKGATPLDVCDNDWIREAVETFIRDNTVKNLKKESRNTSMHKH